MRSIRSYGRYVRLSLWLKANLNFYRVHLLSFTLIPLISAAVFYASNGRTKISYLDSLFMCASAMTSSGLNTINLSTITVWQQVILAFLMFIGNSTTISLVVLFVRKSYFKSRCEEVVRMSRQQRHERDLIRPKFQKTTTGATVFGRIKTRAQTAFGWEPTPIIPEAREDVMGSNQRVVIGAGNENRQQQTHGRPVAVLQNVGSRSDESGETFIGATPALVKQDKSGLPTSAAPPSAASGMVSTPPNNGVISGFTDSPTEESRADRVSPLPSTTTAGAPSAKIRPRTLALGHESDRFKKLKDLPSSIRLGAREDLQTDEPSTYTREERERESKKEEHERSHNNAPDQPSANVISESPTAHHDIAQFANSDLPSNFAEFTTSPNEIIEFESSAHTPLEHQAQAFAAPVADSLSHSAPGLGGQTIPSPSSRKKSHAPHVRSNFPHSSNATSHRRHATFTDEAHPHKHDKALTAHHGGERHRSHTRTVHIPHVAHPNVSRPHDTNPRHQRRQASVYVGQGGLPSPFVLAWRWVVKHFAALERFLGEHEKEIAKETEGVGKGSGYVRTDSHPDQHGEDATAPDIDEVSLEEDELERMGGAEYNALVVLSWIVVGHYVLHHAIAFVVLAPYSAKIPLVRDVIQAQEESSGRTLNTTWFALFTVISAYANAGLTLVDTSLVQMSSAYVLIFVIMWLILAGATAFPLSLRFFIWLGTKIFSRQGNTHKGLKYLLKHPRRCFMYLFPAHQSWYLLFTLVVIFFIDWIAYLTFNIGMPGIESVPTGPRVVGGLLQAAGQRAGGFTTINLQAIAPALQVIYIATMFVQVYPIAMAVRTSNVYEDSGVVIYEPEEDDDEPTNLPPGRGAGFTAYVGWHLKHQLAQDLFWLIAALTTLCAFERARILNPDTGYFNIFSLFFEIVSAFANVGFSLGVATQPFSLSGEFRTIPKLVIIGLMIRGRHRGLPMAIDRAVQLPTEYSTTSKVATPVGASSRRSSGIPTSRQKTIGTHSSMTVRQRQCAQNLILSSDEED